MSNDRLLTHDGITQPISEWALDYGIPADLIIGRLRRGMSIERAITLPMRARPGDRLPLVERKLQEPSRRQPPPRPKTMLTYNGETKPLAEWAAEIGVSAACLRSRIRIGWSLAQALATTDKTRVRKRNYARVRIEHDGQALTFNEWARRTGIPEKTIRERIRKGKPVALALTVPPRAGGNPWRGVVSDLSASQGTGAGSTAQETPEIDFLGTKFAAYLLD